MFAALRGDDVEYHGLSVEYQSNDRALSVFGLLAKRVRRRPALLEKSNRRGLLNRYAESFIATPFVVAFAISPRAC